MKDRRPLISALFAACACAAVLVVSAAPAQAAQSATKPCWEQLLNEWYGGAITSTFAIPCYHQAIDHLPTDVQQYSNARDDIEHALAQQIARNEHHAVTAVIGHKTETVPVTPLPKAPSSTTTKKKKSPISKAISDITPGGPGSFPLPLLILGLLAILLVLAGAGGLIWRRYQGRRGTA